MGHSIVADDSTFFLFGGQTNDNIAINDTYAFKSGTIRAEANDAIPAERKSCSLTFRRSLALC